jgi:hypothetical protein
MDLSDVLKVAGAVALVAAGFTIGLTVGLAVFGVLLVAAGVISER